jgi:hypothetical protein
MIWQWLLRRTMTPGETGATTTGRMDLWDNPMGTDGFEFVEYTAPDTAALGRLFETMGFAAVARHRSKNVTLYRQGDVNFIVNAEPESFAQAFARAHGPSVCAMAFRVADAAYAYKRALELGAKPFVGKVGPMELNIPAIEGIGGSVIYLVDRYGPNGSIYDVDFKPIGDADLAHEGVGLAAVDHLTHNVQRGRMTAWADFYTKLFNFREIRYFDIEGKLTGLRSKAMTSPCGKIRIPSTNPPTTSRRSRNISRPIAARHPAHRPQHRGHLRDRRAAGRAGRHFLGHARHLLRGDRPPPAEPRRGPRPPAPQPHPGRRRARVEGRRPPPATADLHQDRDRPDLLRDHPAQGRRGLRRRQLSAPSSNRSNSTRSAAAS